MKQKTLVQRLQSRISLRRNDIRELEDWVKEQRMVGFTVGRNHLSRVVLRELATEQKLDRELFNILLEREADARSFMEHLDMRLKEVQPFKKFGFI